MNKKVYRTLTLTLILCVMIGMFSIVSYAATGVSIGNRDVSYTDSNLEAEYYLSTTVYYSSWTSAGLNIYSMVANVTNTGDDIASPYFYAGNEYQEDECCGDRSSGVAGGPIRSGTSARREVRWSRVVDDTTNYLCTAVTDISVQYEDSTGNYVNGKGRRAIWYSDLTYDTRNYN